MSREQATILRARGAIRRILRREHGGGRVAWLDLQKTMEELRPSRLLHRAMELAEEFECSRPNPATFKYIVSTKVVKAAGQRVLCIMHDTIMFTTAGQLRWTAEERDQIVVAGGSA